MRLPSFNDLDQEQRNIYRQGPNQSMLVIGPPGSGKTSMAIWRARLLISPELQKSVVLVTRNRLLAAVAGQLALEHDGAPIAATTMNSFVSQDYSTRFQRNIPQVVPYEYRWAQILQEYEEAGIRPTLDHLIVDEGQNLPPGFFLWAVRFGARAVSVFADENQTTHENGSQVADFAAAGFANVMPLLTNHRNTQEIVDLVAQFHTDRTLPQPPASRGRSLERPRLMTVANWAGLVQAVAARLANRGGSVGVIVYRRSEVMHVHALLAQALGQTRVDCYTSGTARGGEAAIRMRDEGVTVISGESAIGLEFDALFLHDLSRSLPPQTPLQRRRLYMLSARARDSLILVNGPELLDAAQLASLPRQPLLEQ